jgi:hypothetical protein
MREIEPILPPELRSTLDAYYTAPQPDSAFAERLEVQLRKQHAGLIVRTPPASFHRSSPAGAAALDRYCLCRGPADRVYSGYWLCRRRTIDPGNAYYGQPIPRSDSARRFSR